MVKRRGCVVVPSVSRANLNLRLRAKDPIQLRVANGQIIDTHIVSIEMLCGSKAKDRIAFLLPDTIRANDIPRGTEIWINSNDEKTLNPKNGN